MDDWLLKFKYNPLKPLLESGDKTIIYFTKRDLIGREVDSIDHIWNLPEVRKMVEWQQSDGSWKPKKDGSGVKYSLIEPGDVSGI